MTGTSGSFPLSDHHNTQVMQALRTVSQSPYLEDGKPVPPILCAFDSVNHNQIVQAFKLAQHKSQ